MAGHHHLCRLFKPAEWAHNKFDQHRLMLVRALAEVSVGVALVTAFAQHTDANTWGKASRALLATRSG